MHEPVAIQVFLGTGTKWFSQFLLQDSSAFSHFFVVASTTMLCKYGVLMGLFYRRQNSLYSPGKTGGIPQTAGHLAA